MITFHSCLYQNLEIPKEVISSCSSFTGLEQPILVSMENSVVGITVYYSLNGGEYKLFNEPITIENNTQFGFKFEITELTQEQTLNFYNNTENYKISSYTFRAQ